MQDGSRAWANFETNYFLVNWILRDGASFCTPPRTAGRPPVQFLPLPIPKERAVEGKVFLVGAGPGDPELLTVRALRLLQSADVVLHDDLISAQILNLAPKSAHLRSVGKRCGKKKIHQEEINNLLITYASFGLKVVRLKSGDPLLFGRAGEEIEALRQANVEFEIVPGITSASAAAAALEASLTQRS